MDTNPSKGISSSGGSSGGGNGNGRLPLNGQMMLKYTNVVKGNFNSFIYFIILALNFHIFKISRAHARVCVCVCNFTLAMKTKRNCDSK